MMMFNDESDTTRSLKSRLLNALRLVPIASAAITKTNIAQVAIPLPQVANFQYHGIQLRTSRVASRKPSTIAGLSLNASSSGAIAEPLSLTTPAQAPTGAKATVFGPGVPQVSPIENCSSFENTAPTVDQPQGDVRLDVSSDSTKDRPAQAPLALASGSIEGRFGMPLFDSEGTSPEFEVKVGEEAREVAQALSPKKAGKAALPASVATGARKAAKRAKDKARGKSSDLR